MRRATSAKSRMIASSAFLHIPQLAITWGLFFSAGLLTFLFNATRSNHAFSFRALFHHIFPFDFRSSKSVHMDVIIYVIRKFTDFAPGLLGVTLTAIASSSTFNALRAINQNHTGTHPGYATTAICSIILLFISELSDYMVHY